MPGPFRFEEKTYCSPNCLPMAARRNLDRVGLKVGLAQWRALGEQERTAICSLPAERSEQRAALRAFVRKAVMRACAQEPQELPEGARRMGDPPAELPDALARAAERQGLTLTDAMWHRLDADQRYALMKLGLGPRSHQLAVVMEEFFGGSG